MGLKGLQLLFDAAVSQKEKRGRGVRSLLVRPSTGGAPRSSKHSVIIEFDLMKGKPHFRYCLPEDNARRVEFIVGQRCRRDFFEMEKLH